MNQEQAREELAHIASIVLPLLSSSQSHELMYALLSDVSLLMQAVGAVVVPWCAEHDGPISNYTGNCPAWNVNWDKCRLEKPARHWTIGDVSDG